MAAHPFFRSQVSYGFCSCLVVSDQPGLIDPLGPRPVDLLLAEEYRAEAAEHAACASLVQEEAEERSPQKLDHRHQDLLPFGYFFFFFFLLLVLKGIYHYWTYFHFSQGTSANGGLWHSVIAHSWGLLQIYLILGETTTET